MYLNTSVTSLSMGQSRAIMMDTRHHGHLESLCYTNFSECHRGRMFFQYRSNMLCQPQYQQKYLVSDKVSRTEHWHNSFPSLLIQHSGSQSLDKFLGYCEATSLYTAHLLCLQGSSEYHKSGHKASGKIARVQTFFFPIFFCRVEIKFGV